MTIRHHSFLILHSNNMLVVWLVVLLAVKLHAGKAIIKADSVCLQAICDYPNSPVVA